MLFSTKHIITRWIFLRLLGVIYLVAFLSIWVQIEGLIGSNGILPAAEYLDAAQQQTGPERFRLLPTLFWFGASDGYLHAVCAVGVLLSFLLLIGITPPLVLFLLWLCYLSIVSVGQVFLSFQWDILLLETGFLAIFFAPWQLRPRLAQLPPASTIMLWLLYFLLFKLMFQSGLVKLLSGDPTWRNLSALTYHFETQPLPTWIGWYMYQLPAWFHMLATVAVFIIELGVPFLIFAPRRWRLGGCAVLILLQIAILLSGNYTFFNYLTIVLCLLLIDDTIWRRWLPQRLIRKFSDPSIRQEPVQIPRPVFYHTRIVPLIAMTLLLLSTIQMVQMVLPLPSPLQQVIGWIRPLRTINNYGLFAVMTTRRFEIIVEGSNDRVTWQTYEFKWKPGDVRQRPGFVAPHQPRLDWQMWFAALGDYQRNPWFIQFLRRLLEGSPEVLALLETNPFPQAPPRFIRAVSYQYHFTNLGSEQANTGAWWYQIAHQQLYVPVLSLPEK